MAEQPPAPPPTAAATTAAPPPPANAGFKLKLKLGGGSSSTTVSAAQPSSSTSIATASPSLPSTSASLARASTSQSTTAGTSAASSDAAHTQARNEDVSMLEGSEADHDDNDDDFAPEEMDDYGGEYATSKKAAAKLQRMRKTSTPAAASGHIASSTALDASAGDASLLLGSEQDTTTMSNASPGPSTSVGQNTARYETSIGSIVLPTSATSGAGTSRKRKSAANEGGGTGLGRGWRKGLKGYQKGDGLSPGPGAGRGETVSGTPSAATSAAPSSRKRKSQATAVALGTNVDESSLDRNADPEEFVPAMAPSGGLVTSEKWANGLPGGNEQSRLTASMASAVNKQFPVGPPPKTGSGFLQPQPLDKSTPVPRSWKKVKREIIGPSGIPFSVTIWQGDNESKYADYMLEHPRPPPVDKKAIPAVSAVGSTLDAGSPAPEGSYPPSDGTPADAASESGPSQSHAGTPTGRGGGGGRGRGRAARAPGPRRKPGPPKKAKALPPPIIGSTIASTLSTPSADATTSSAALPDASAASSTMSADTSDAGITMPKIEIPAEEASRLEAKTEDHQDSPMPA